MIPPSSRIMDPEEVNDFEERLQEAFTPNDLHIIIDIDGRAEVWSGDTALGVKWASADPAQLVGLPDSINPRKLTDILYDMVHQEVDKILNPQKEVEDGN